MINVIDAYKGTGGQIYIPVYPNGAYLAVYPTLGAYNRRESGLMKYVKEESVDLSVMDPCLIFYARYVYYNGKRRLKREVDPTVIVAESWDSGSKETYKYKHSNKHTTHIVNKNGYNYLHRKTYPRFTARAKTLMMQTYDKIVFLDDCTNAVKVFDAMKEAQDFLMKKKRHGQKPKKSKKTGTVNKRSKARGA